MPKQRAKLTAHPLWQKWWFYFSLVAAGLLFFVLINSFGLIFNQAALFLRYFSPFVVGALLAYVLSIPCKKLEVFLRKRQQKFWQEHAKSAAIISVFVVFVLLIILMMSFIIPTTFLSLSDFMNNLTHYLDNTKKYFVALQADNAWAADFDFAVFFDSLTFKELVKNISLENVWRSFQGLLGLSSTVARWFLALIVTFYFLWDAARWRKIMSRTFHAYVPGKQAEIILKYFHLSDDYFRKYVYFNTVDSLIIGGIVSVAMFFLCPQYAIPLGLIGGLLNMIPYFGAVVGSVIVAVIVLLTNGLGYGLAAAVFLLIIQQVDGNIIKPKLFGTSLDMNPLLVIFSITIGGAVAGVWGMFLAVPVFAILKNIFSEALSRQTKPIKRARHPGRSKSQEIA